MFDDDERRFFESTRIARLATADADGRPSVVPVCFAFVGDRIVTPIDEKPKAVPVGELRRSRDIRANPRVALLVDHYEADWDKLGWVQVRGRATLVATDEAPHSAAVTALRAKYEQYADHVLEDRPVICIAPGRVVSWGKIERSTDEKESSDRSW